MLEPLRNERRDYAWKYFSFHADQRIKTFNFYILLCTVVVGGILAFIKDARSPWMASPGTMLLAFASFVFWKLDRRNKDLICHAEKALRRIEIATCEDARGSLPPECCVFSTEDLATEKTKSENGRPTWSPLSWPCGYFTYSTCFGWVFAVIGFGSLALTFALPLLPANQPAQQVPQQQFFIGGQAATPAQQTGAAKP
ncbi:MAG: hypothetical protein JNM56_32915 [Planctomycetia bacterium]|nr:hypothetical protein [Planctomycetia bacterium]